MKIFICSSKHFYGKVMPIKETLEKQGHVITLPNSFDTPMKEEEMKAKSQQEHITWKSSMLRLQGTKVAANDAIVVLNFEKKGIPNYIGGATFLETFKAFELGKKIFFYNPLPEGIFNDELRAINPIILNGDLALVK
jgi:hypothetical protein